jgi:hypothetical protein
MTITADEYQEALTARDQATEARDQIFADGGVVSLDGIQTLTNKTMTSLLMTGAPRANGLTADGRAQFMADLGLGPVFATRAEAQALSTGRTAAAAIITVMHPLAGQVHYVYDPAGTMLATGDGRTWSPLYDVTPEHAGAVGTGLVADQAPVAACLQWGCDNGRRAVMRHKYGLSDEVFVDYNASLTVEARGAEFCALAGFPVNTRMVRIKGAPSDLTRMWWDGGWWDGRNVPYAGPLGQGNFFEIVTGNSTGPRRIHIDGMCAGDDWREGMAGGDAGLYINANWTDLDLGVMIAFVDLGCYLTSGATGTSTDANRREVHKIRGTFVKCWRAASAKRAARVLDVDITCIDCLGGWSDSPADIGGVTPDRADYNGQVRVRAIRTQWAINGSRPYAINYDAVQTDQGVILPAVGDVPKYRSTEGGYRFQGANKCTGKLSASGVNAAVLADGADPANFRGVEFEDAAAGVGCFDNRFDLTCYDIYRVVYEQDSSNRNIVEFRSDTGLVTKVGANSYFTRITNPADLGNVTTGTITASGDISFPAATGTSLELTSNHNAGLALAKLVFRDQDGSAVTGQEIGKIEFQTGDAGSPGVGAYVKAKAADDDGRVSLFFGAGSFGSVVEAIEAASDRVRLSTSGTLRLDVGTARVSSTLPIRPAGYTVATLPAASAAGTGATAYVTDAAGPTYRAIVAGGGSATAPVFSDGTNWRCS